MPCLPMNHLSLTSVSRSLRLIFFVPLTHPQANYSSGLSYPSTETTATSHPKMLLLCLKFYILFPLPRFSPSLGPPQWWIMNQATIIQRTIHKQPSLSKFTLLLALPQFLWPLSQ